MCLADASSKEMSQHRCETWGSLAGRNCAKCCVFSIVLWPRGIEQLASKNEGGGGLAAQDVAQIVTTLQRESDSEVQIVKVKRYRGVFWGSKLRFSWLALAQGFRHVAKCVAGAGDAGVRKGCKNAGCRGGFEEGPQRCFSRGWCRD